MTKSAFNYTVQKLDAHDLLAYLDQDETVITENLHRRLLVLVESQQHSFHGNKNSQRLQKITAK